MPEPEEERRPRLVWRLARRVAGWAFVILGLVGLVLPVLQGVIFLVLGLTLLGSESAWARTLLQKLRDRLPGRRSGGQDEDGEAARHKCSGGDRVR